MKEDTLSSRPMAQGRSLYVIIGHVGEEKADYLQERMLLREDGWGTSIACKVSVAWSWKEKKSGFGGPSVTWYSCN